MYACEKCHKATAIGIDSSHNYGGGWSMRGPRSRKVWKPNLQTLRINQAGKMVKMRLCTKCIRKIKAVNPYASKPRPNDDRPMAEAETAVATA